jgi:tripartite-type tricarboxylate transporter receptor subunit TctC
MKKEFIRRSLAVAAFAAAVGFGGPAFANGGPIKFVVPYPPGGPTDQVARLVANEAAQILSTPILIENKAGAAGMIGGAFVARSKPDGKTFFVGSNGTLVINQALYAKMPYDPEKSFTPVAGMGASPLLLVTRRNLGARDLPTLITMGKKEPGKLTMGSASSGNITHLAGEYVTHQMDFKVTHVPFAGSAPAITNLIGGSLDIMFDALPSSLQQAKAGRIVPLAILDAKRFPLLPNVPTMKELGFPNSDVSAWIGLVAPAGTPAAKVNEINRAINEALKKPELVEKLHNIGVQPLPGSPEVFGKFITDDRARWIPVAKQLDVRAD